MRHAGSRTRAVPSPRLAAFRALAPALLLLAAAAAAEDYGAWAHSQGIWFDTSPDGANTSADVAGFPVLVRLSSPELDFGQAKAGGEDLRFSKPDGTPLPYEIERWDSAAGKAEIWVRLDTVRAGARGLLMRMHWGNPDAAAASAPAAVFPASDGFVSVWHLKGAAFNSRENAVAGGMPAVPANYDGDERREGMIGWADSLDGRDPADHLQTWEPFDGLAGGFTFSVWAYPAAEADSSRLMDFGNGDGLDNLVLARGGGGGDLVFASYKGSGRADIVAAKAVVPARWQHFAVTVSGRAARLYRDGSLVASGEMPHGVTGARRAFNYLGRSNRHGDAGFAGMLDEPVVARAARSADWIRLAWANQKPGQSLLSFTAPATCEARFGVPADLSVREGGVLSLAGIADCADQFHWSVVEGPIGRLVDPNVKTLELPVPRVAGDTVSIFRFTAHYGDSTRTAAVRVAIEDAIPDPVFSLPGELAWDGSDSLWLSPVIENLAALEASAQPDLHFTWKVDGTAVDTAWGAAGLLLKAASAQGPLKVELCLHNNGPESCRETVVKMGAVTRLRPAPPSRTVPAGAPLHTVDGRRATTSGAGARIRKVFAPGG